MVVYNVWDERSNPRGDRRAQCVTSSWKNWWQPSPARSGVDPVLKDEAKVKDAWTKIVNEYSRALGTNLVYALLTKLKLELGIK